MTHVLDDILCLSCKRYAYIDTTPDGEIRVWCSLNSGLRIPNSLHYKKCYRYIDKYLHSAPCTGDCKACESRTEWQEWDA